MNAAAVAGLASTTLFTVSLAPMVWRAARTRDLAAYSLGHLVLNAFGNVIHTVYVLSLPAGPIWVLHGVYVVTTGQMLAWKLRHPVGQGSRAGVPAGGTRVEEPLGSP
jgi:hypothetical protein